MNPFVPLVDPLCPVLVIEGTHHMSAAYSIRGMATLRYSCRMYCPLVPDMVFASRLIWFAHLVPFARAYAACSLYRSSLSRMTPRQCRSKVGSDEPDDAIPH